MQQQVGVTGGAVWRALNGNGEMSLPALKREVKGRVPAIDWAIEWLAREDKIIFAR
jgi:Winged helix-turn-helix domain (DUF2582)